MKKLLLLALLPVLLLAGCANANADPTETTPSVETQPPGYYVADSAMEAQTNGAVRQYDLPAGEYRWLSAIGDQLLLASAEETAMLTVLTGIDCVPTAQLQIDPDLLSGSYKVLYNGFAYYDEAENQAIFLDPQLQEINRLTLPKDMQGSPVFSPNGEEIFYCAGQEIRAFQVERKISRLIKSHSYKSAVLLGSYFEGKILSCRVEDAQGVEDTVYISSESGQTLRADNGINGLYTYEDRFLALRMDGVIPQKIVGTRDGAMQDLLIDTSNVTSALELGGVVSYYADESGLQLAFYDVTTGKKTAAVTLAGVGAPDALLADRWSGCIWILATAPETEGKRLLRWNLKATPVEEEAVYTGTLYTSQSPDQAGLDACQDRVDALDKAYGVSIRIWQEAVKYPGGHQMTAEHQTAAINGVLDQLEPVLAEFPQKFLLKSVSSRIRICVVRAVDAETKSVQYWHENDAFIVLPVGVDVRAEFLKGLGYVVDSHVLGNSSKYDYWDALNPEGFVYGTADEAYLSGEQRAFADAASMNSAVEDRSRILYEAMKPDNADMFQSEIMQKKLLLLCQAIRDAWNLQWKKETYPWEQYLTESIAYKK